MTTSGAPPLAPKAPAPLTGRRLIYVLPKLATGGDEHFEAVPALLAEIQRGNEVTLIVERGDPAAAEGLPFTVEVLAPAHPLRRLLNLWRALRKHHAADDTAIFTRISQYAAIVAGLYAKLSGATSYYWHCGEIRYHPTRSFNDFRNWLKSGIALRAAMKINDFLVTGSPQMGSFYRDAYGVPPEKIRLVPNDFDPRRFFPLEGEAKGKLREHLGYPHGPVVLAVHRLSPIRRTPFYFPPLLDLLERNRSTVLVVVGAGPDLAELTTLVNSRRLSERVMFVGSKPHREIAHYMQAADIFVNPSFVEGFPRVVIEAMGSGLPVISTDAGGTADLFPAELGRLVVARGDPGALAAALESVIQGGKPLWSELGRAFSDHARRFETAAVGAMYRRLIDADTELTPSAPQSTGD